MDGAKPSKKKRVTTVLRHPAPAHCKNIEYFQLFID